MSAYTGDFLGFTYNGVRSSTLGITRVSDGSRFNENLLPTQQNRTVNVPGRDEIYFFGSDSTQRQFSISYAFDSMTEYQLNQLRALFGSKEIRDLQFDERGDITWQAKVSASSIKYIPFDENGQTIYKGEGTVQFTCYQPFGVKTQYIQSADFIKNEGDTKIFEDDEQIVSYIKININNNNLPINWNFSGVFVSNQLAVKVLLKDSKKNNIADFEVVVTNPKGDDGAININSDAGIICGMQKNGSVYKKTNNIYSLYNGELFSLNQPSGNYYICFGKIRNPNTDSDKLWWFGHDGLGFLYKTKHY